MGGLSTTLKNRCAPPAPFPFYLGLEMGYFESAFNLLSLFFFF